jgi:ornithine cyclodeaminase/alanine dehydrogenase-like protein (mu-crystallin family)
MQQIRKYFLEVQKMSDTRIDFLYLDEQDMIKAGVLDMAACVKEMTEVYHLMGEGDYIMGGGNGNSHGQPIFFPAHPTHPGMPAAGPDRRFMTMEAYIGGKYHICGEKWYGSNRANIEKSLPRSILMVMLNDVDTGAPIALMSGNMLSNMRTGAIPGVGAQYLVRKGSKVCGLIGAGVITRLSFDALALTVPTLDTVKIYDIFPAASERLKKHIEENYPQIKNVIVANSLEETIRDSDIVHMATSGKNDPVVDPAWIKKGAFFSLPADFRMDMDAIAKNCTCIVDNWKTYEAWKEELTYPYSANVGLLGCTLLDMLHDGKVTMDYITNLGDVIAKKKPGRTSDDQIILFGMGGLPTYDVAWAWHCLQNAKALKLGKALKLWDKPAGV